jgi:hypothetical protein
MGKNIQIDHPPNTTQSSSFPNHLLLRLKLLIKSTLNFGAFTIEHNQTSNLPTLHNWSQL